MGDAVAQRWNLSVVWDEDVAFLVAEGWWFE
jgi:hypothetical protein